MHGTAQKYLDTNITISAITKDWEFAITLKP